MTIFSEATTLYSSYLFRRATFLQHTFSEELLFHSYASSSQLHFLFIVAESRIIDKIYLITWLHKVLWNCYFLMKLVFEQATFSEPLLFKDPYFFKAVIIFRKSYFFRNAVYWNSSFWTANLVFTVTLFIYHLEINPGVFRFKLPGGAKNGAPLRKSFH